MAEKMELLIQNPGLAQKMGIEGRKLAEETYDVKKVNQAIMEIMEIPALGMR